MDAMQAMLTRKSIKKYKPDMVPKEIIEQIIEAGLNAPSGLNKQAPIILAVTDKQTRDELSKLNAGKDPFFRSDPFYGAPVVLVVLADKSAHTYLYDGSLVMENLQLAAHALGLGACWIHRAKETFEQPEGKALLAKLGIEGDYEGIGNCIIGYPDIDPEKKPRKENRVYWVE
ncbi:MAG: nitroreductase family protein [Clostridiales bacterium]|jgi:nitroreductase|nr:nitroreductase family protein [Clostridiales bacterium]